MLSLKCRYLAIRCLVLSSVVSLFILHSLLTHSELIRMSSSSSSCSWSRSSCCSNSSQYLADLKLSSRKRFKDRLDTLRRGCDTWSKEIAEKRRVLRKGKFVYIDIEHHLLYCQIYKTGSTTWAYNLAKLANASITEAKERFYCHLPRDEELVPEVDHVLSVAFVRHPFERLVSTFKNRIQTNFWGAMRPTIKAILERRANSTASTFPVGRQSNIEFKEFIDFVINTPVHELNLHLTPQFMLCPFCTLQFDVLGHTETFDEDVEHIIQQLKLQKVLASNSTRNRSGANVTKELQVLDASTLLHLYNVYKIDFELFGYNDLHHYILKS